MNGPELRDIHLPDAVGWWPPAPGWWLLLALVVGLALLLPWLRRWLRQKPVRRLSLGEFERIRSDYRNGLGETETVNRIAALLRRTLIGYRGRTGFAASTGEAWLAQLEQLAPSQGFTAAQLHTLARGRYRAGDQCDVDGLLVSCERWIRSLPRGQGHVPA